jgi:hypothetical protein
MTTQIGAGKSRGNREVVIRRASTPPEEAPMTTIRLVVTTGAWQKI